MAIVRNNSERQYNIKRMVKNRRVLVRLVPGLNVVDDKTWCVFVPESGKNIDPYVQKLADEKQIDFGDALNEAHELDEDVPEAATKDTPVPVTKVK